MEKVVVWDCVIFNYYVHFSSEKSIDLYGQMLYINVTFHAAK